MAERRKEKAGGRKLLSVIVIGLIFFILLLAPIVGATLYYRTHKGEILHINQNRIRDARYFGKSFASLVESRLKESTGNTIKLSREEVFLDGDKQKKFEETVEDLVICRTKAFSVAKESGIKEFQKEIYAAENLIFEQPGLEIRAAFSRKDIIIGDETEIGRWVDAEGTVAVYDNCKLGMSVSSKMRISIGKNCTFRRLYAPEICLGQYPGAISDPTEGLDSRIFRLPIMMNKERNIKYISKEMINEDGIVEASVLSWRNVIVTENVIVQGDVRSHKGVKLCDGAVICGNVFAEEDVILGKHACVLGNIFSQENIYLEEGAVIGQRGRICSAIARGKITFGQNNFVFGYVSCEGQGKVAPEVLEDDGKKKKLCFLEAVQPPDKIVFKDLYDYEHVDQQGFRFNRVLKETEIPEGAVNIPRSMFFGCSALERIKLPASLSEIRAYAFADCVQLSEIEGFGNTCITKIETSAFENCEKLERLKIPAYTSVLEGAVFAGCKNLKELTFGELSVLETLGDHCFKGCESLQTIRLPKETSYVGVSAFLGCSKLELLQIPLKCKDSPGILELPEEIVEIYDLPEPSEEEIGNGEDAL